MPDLDVTCWTLIRAAAGGDAAGMDVPRGPVVSWPV